MKLHIITLALMLGCGSLLNASEKRFHSSDALICSSDEYGRALDSNGEVITKQNGQPVKAPQKMYEQATRHLLGTERMDELYRMVQGQVPTTGLLYDAMLPNVSEGLFVYSIMNTDPFTENPKPVGTGASFVKPARFDE